MELKVNMNEEYEHVFRFSIVVELDSDSGEIVAGYILPEDHVLEKNYRFATIEEINSLDDDAHKGLAKGFTNHFPDNFSPSEKQTIEEVAYKFFSGR